MPAHYLDASALQPFNPAKKSVQCANGSKTALAWAFSSCIPALARTAMIGEGTDNASLRLNATPAMQWNYSMFHLAHHFETIQQRKFILEDEEETAAILIEITALRACPDDVKGVNALPQSAYYDPEDKEKLLGPVPIFFVRYLHEAKNKDSPRKPSKESVKFITSAMKEGKGVMKISAASVDEINFAHKSLRKGQSMLDAAKNSHVGIFMNSVIIPTQITKTKSPGKAPNVCAACGTVTTSKKTCSRCKVTCYCSKECQVNHWKRGGHKEVCNKTPRKDNDTHAQSRKSFVFGVDEDNLGLGPGMTHLSINQKTGTSNISGADKKHRSELKKKGHNIFKAPTSKNVHGDKEFIVKLQPPVMGPTAGPWMCYDGPTRSFQSYIPSDTPGLSEVYALLQQEGVHTSNPMLNIRGYKGYFNAKWEGSSVRVFHDRIVSPQIW